MTTKQTIIEAVPKGIFSNGYVFEKDRRKIAEVDGAWFKEDAAFEVAGVGYQVRRRSGEFVLEGEGRTLARSIKPSAFRSKVEIQILQLGGLALTMDKLSLWSSDFGLFQHDQQVGQIKRSGFLNRRVSIELPEALSLPVQIFVYWLAQVTWDRESAA